MDLASLQIFCDLIETESFTHAAARNFVSQSAVSQRIRSLEREYGQIFVERGKGKGRVAPTEAGKALYDGAKPILSDASDLEARLRGLSDDVSGTVRVATVYSVGLHALPGRLKPFLAAHPGVNVHLEYSPTGKVYQDVLMGAIDVGIVACPAGRTGIEIVAFGEEEMVVVCAPENPIAQLSEMSLAELNNQPFIAFSDDIPTRRLIDQQLLSAGAVPRIVMSFDNIETIKNLVEIGNGLSLLPANAVQQETRSGSLATVPLSADDAFLRPVGLLLKNNRAHRGAVRAFVEAIREKPYAAYETGLDASSNSSQT